MLAIAPYFLLAVDELWIAFVTGNNFRYLAAHQYASALGPDKARALPMFHAITGCHPLLVHGTWDVWMSHNKDNGSFIHLTASPDEILDHHLAVLERFDVLLYDRASRLYKVNLSLKHCSIINNHCGCALVICNPLYNCNNTNFR